MLQSDRIDEIENPQNNIDESGVGHSGTAEATASAAVIGYDLIAHLRRQREFSRKAFGPGTRANGVIAHI